MKKKVEFTTPEAERDYKKFKKAMDKKHKMKKEKKKVYCQDCRFHGSGMRALNTSIPYLSQDQISFPSDYCTEPHKVYTYSAITKIDSSDNCHVKNYNNNCKYFKRKLKR